MYEGAGAKSQLEYIGYGEKQKLLTEMLLFTTEIDIEVISSRKSNPEREDSIRNKNKELKII